MHGSGGHGVGADGDPGAARRGADVRLPAAERVRAPDGRRVAGERRPGVHDAPAPRARRPRGAGARRSRARHRPLPAHGRRARGGRRVVDGSGRPRCPRARRAGHQARPGRLRARRRRARRRAGAAQGVAARAARLHPPPGRGRRCAGPGPRLGARARPSRVRPRGRAAVARPRPGPGPGRGPAPRGTPRRTRGTCRRRDRAHGAGPLSAALRLRAVSRVHGSGAGRVEALRAVDLDVAHGELVAVMGASGSGKSTLLHLAGGLDTATSGQVLVGDVDLGTLRYDERAALRRTSVGYVFQDFNLVPVLTAAENVAAPLELDGVRAGRARSLAHAALAVVGLDGLGDRMPHELSGGQAQRVAIARALVGPRRLLLADEPTGALDSATGTAVMGLLRDRVEAGAAALVVTHEPRFAAWADRTVFLADGEVVDTLDAAAGPEALFGAGTAR
ncbi:ABC transporter ATP-binding protein [Xylanimonas protaetiae]|uniref:ABC transporter ATP-binding protein n=1 Tax=Xylanimonas protaetiae TaxID=2509457 RepID=A0A4P6FN48_9MICO|nr:ABC transporter ATP-binding protein [Xylanimonas protaetiae]